MTDNRLTAIWGQDGARIAAEIEYEWVYTLQGPNGKRLFRTDDYLLLEDRIERFRGDALAIGIGTNAFTVTRRKRVKVIWLDGEEEVNV